MAFPLNVTSEIGLLQAVLVHTPGAELRAVTPGNKGDYLYDDIIQVEPAQREHRRFVAVLQRFAQVYQVADLLAEALERPEAREFFIRGTLDVVPDGKLTTTSCTTWTPRLWRGASWRGSSSRAGPSPGRSTPSGTCCRRSPTCSSPGTSAS